MLIYQQIIDFIIGIVVGGAVIGSSVSRTLNVRDGKVLRTIVAMTVANISYYLSVTFLVKGNIIGYLGTCVGGTIVLVTMALKNRKRLNITRKDIEKTTISREVINDLIESER